MKSAVPHAAHWGAFIAETEGGRLVRARPIAADPAPAALLASMPAAVHARCRIDRPHVRRGWLAGDRGGGTIRGAEAFVPVSWEAATRLVAGELARVKALHGPAAIFGGSYGWSSAGRFHHARGQLHRALAAIGGYTGQITNYSYAAGMTLLPHILGTNAVVQGPVVGWREIAGHARLLVAFGGILAGNGQVGSGGLGRHGMAEGLEAAARAGVRIVVLSALRPALPAGVAAEWVALRPNTDTALMLAMAWVLFAEGLADRGFLDRCTVGAERLEAYVRGESDGVAKTPAWAEGICGVGAARIAALARACAALPALLTATWSLQRAEGGEQPYWMLTALAALLGRIGQAGCGVAFGLGSIGELGAARRELPVPSLPRLHNPSASAIPVARLADMLEKPGQPYDYNGERRTYPDIRLIYWAGGNPFHHHQDLNRLCRAWARAQTIVVHEPWWTATARRADIVLPATTTLERDDIGAGARDRFVFAMQRAIAPQFQARDDFAILGDITDELGARAAYTEGRDTAGWLRAMYADWAGIARHVGLEVPDFETFWERGVVEIAAPAEAFVPFAAFAAGPGANPLRTASGRIELYCETIAGFGYADCPGHPVWREPREYLGAAGAAGKLHLLTVQPASRLHSQLDAGAVSLASKIAGREPITLHPEDAAARGLAAGMVVRVFNERGACLAGLRLDDGLLPGVAVMATGAWFDPLDPAAPGSLCIHGNPNVLTQDVGTSRLGQGPVAMSCLVAVEAFAGVAPPPTVHEPPPVFESS